MIESVRKKFPDKSDQEINSLLLIPREYRTVGVVLFSTTYPEEYWEVDWNTLDKKNAIKNKYPHSTHIVFSPTSQINLESGNQTMKDRKGRTIYTLYIPPDEKAKLLINYRTENIYNKTDHNSIDTIIFINSKVHES